MTKTKSSRPPSPIERISAEALPDPRLVELAQRVASAGGRAFVVGGWVRDQLLGRASKDVDLEVLGLGEEELATLLAEFGERMHFGRSFGVTRVKGLDADITCVPDDGDDPLHAFAAAARRRDLTVNSIGWDPLSGMLLDPHGGFDDLRRGVLRETDAESFGADPLRGVRVAQFAARFEMRVSPSLGEACRRLDLSEVAGERVWEEFRKLLLDAPRPSVGLAFLEECGLLRFLPELAALVGVPQDPRWHPEGCVWTHTLLVVDCAAALRRGDAEADLLLMWAALAHDLGKPATTRRNDERDRITAHGHESRGVDQSEALLRRLHAPSAVVEGVSALVRHHLAPVRLADPRNPAGAAAYRRLARALENAGVNLALLERVARADSLGRTTDEALRGEFSAGDRFLERARELAIAERSLSDVVLGRHLIARGYAPGPPLGELLRRCRAVQDETGWIDVDRILQRVLDDSSPDGVFQGPVDGG